MSDYAVVNPATGETVATYPTFDAAQVENAVAAAKAAHDGWSRSSTVAERAALVKRVAQLHRERREELANIIVREMGKPLEQALGEVDFSADIYEFYADNADKITADRPIEDLLGEGTAFMRHSSLGVLLGIMPWNFPYYQVSRFAGPNLINGNTILLKHAPQCPESAAAIEQIHLDAGFPVGVYQDVRLTNEQSAEVIADTRVSGVSLTGSERAGAAVAEVAGRNLKKVVLELGGSDPFYLFSTDDLDAVVEAAVSARLGNNGQACNAAKRFIVQEDLYQDFLDKLTQAFADIKAQDPTLGETFLGPLSSTAATDRLEEQVGRAVSQGAKVAVGGGRNGNFFDATILTDVTPENDAYTEELFGPVAQVYKVADEAEALAVGNAIPFGLGSYLWTKDKEQAERVADQIEAGMVYINLVDADSPELPFGGIKRSGTGRELGIMAANEFVNAKLIRADKW
ncbi:NAD-dependent succinate-semialdehyde dehydrogenase [Galactobacter caseinivorans]|uniref:NAD-dependent succinate-semialdehyde dehydrogenase n=1 Tax=Galactobacter caseinivorans TaxID=2676123 RepID=A0A496PHK2_9MICC|nr:NAD-dependent succinate-semialdehyde dehydrogenase [Galactobacter caseinivorans]RKW69955.1 NAD-dependent succinate-semialdehyde dehydrogenase [Galactobacter caseinivorans]